jgi:hypothetical protein
MLSTMPYTKIPLGCVPTCATTHAMWHMRRGNSMQEERHAQNGCARGRRKVRHVSRSQTGRYVRVFASFRLLVHVSVWSFDRLFAYWHASSCVVAQVETQPYSIWTSDSNKTIKVRN